MSEEIIQEQIAAINEKLDLIIETNELQRRKREELDDLLQDLNLVAKDAFHQSVVMLDKAQVEIDAERITGLFVKILQNTDTFYEMLEMMESARDLIKDVSPIIRQVGLDAVEKLHELERKGYFDVIRETGSLMDKWILVLAEVKPDDKLDDRSLWQIFQQLRSPEVRKSIAYALRVVQALQKS